MKGTDNLSQNEVLLQQLTQIVLNNLQNEQFGVEDLSAQVGMSRSHLHRKLKILKGQSVSQFIREIRLEEALKLLQNDVANVSEIAYMVGFNSPTYFHKCFFEHYGYSPGETKRVLQHGQTNQHPEVKERLRKKTPGRHFFKVVLSVVLLLLVSFTGFYFFKKGDMPSRVERSIAVLPFNNLSSEPENQFFADGIVEDLLNRLSVIEGFKVISRTSSDTFRERGKRTVPGIADELGVSYIVEGSVQKYRDSARITVQLIDAKNDEHIWSQVFDREVADVFKVQSEIAVQIAAELNTILTPEQATNVERNRTTSFKAHELYQLGRFYWNKRTGEGYARSIKYFEQAIAEDPDYGLAYAGMADTYNLMAIQGWIDRKRGRDKAVELALKALVLDEHLAEAHNVLASIYTYIDWDWEAAEKEYLRAIELNPNYATAHHYYSEHLSITGRHKKAREEINTALELDPLSYVLRYVSVKLYFNRGLFHEAGKEVQRGHELQKDHIWSIWYDFLIYRQLDNRSAALEAFKTFGELTGEYDPRRADSVYGTAGLDGLLKWRIELSDHFYRKAEWYGLLGDDVRAMELLEKAFDEGELSPEFSFRYAFRRLHSNPRFIDLLKKTGLYGYP